MTKIPFDKSKWLGVSPEVRQKYMAEDMHIHHPQFVRAVSEIKRRMRRCINENSGAAILFLVPSGAGKTHARNFFKKRWPDRDIDSLTLVPVVAFDVPTGPSALTMGQSLLRSMGDPGWDRGSASKLLDRIVHLLPQVGTELILIDNVHDVPEKRQRKGILEIGGWIRRLVDDGRRLVVLLGTPAAREITMANSQLRRRTAKQLEMDYFYFDDVPSQAQFLRFLHEVDLKLPLAELSHLGSSAVAEAIHRATFGIQDYIFQLLTEAVGIAVRASRERLELSDLEQAFQLVFHDAAKGINPFSENSLRRPLTMEGEPFYNWFDQSNPSLKRTSKHTKEEKTGAR